MSGPGGKSIKETLAAMTVVARTNGLVDFDIRLRAEDFDRLCAELELSDDAAMEAARTGQVKILTVNGVTTVNDGGGF